MHEVADVDLSDPWNGSCTCELCSTWAMTSGSSGLWLLKLLDRPAVFVLRNCGLSTYMFTMVSIKRLQN